jgi:hypothetical protein
MEMAMLGPEIAPSAFLVPGSSRVLLGMVLRRERR